MKLARPLLLLWLGFLVTARADDFDSLRIKWRDGLTGGTNYSLSDGLVKTRLSSITNTAWSYWNSMDKSPTRTYVWSDTASTTDEYAFSTGYSRLQAGIAGRKRVLIGGAGGVAPHVGSGGRLVHGIPIAPCGVGDARQPGLHQAIAEAVIGAAGQPVPPLDSQRVEVIRPRGDEEAEP